MDIIDIFQLVTNDTPIAGGLYAAAFVCLIAGIYFILAGFDIVAIKAIKVTKGWKASVAGTLIAIPASAFFVLLVISTVVNRPPCPIVIPERKTILSESFAQNEWKLGDFSYESATSSFQIVDGAYRAKISFENGNFSEFIPIPHSYEKNFGLGFSAKILDASSPTAFNIGVIFRWKDDDNYYFVRFYQDDRFDILVKKDGEWTTIANFLANPKFKLGEGVYRRFDVFVQDDTITLYLDGEAFYSVKDTSATEAGWIFLTVSSGQDNQDIEVEFDNIVIVNK